MNPVVITFGRYNPPTKGHEKLFKTVRQIAKQEKADYWIYASHSQDKKKNPLTYNQKIQWLKAALPQHRSRFATSNAKTIIQIAQELDKKYTDLILVVGQDRVKEFETLLNKYNGKEYNFDSIRVVSAGQRDPDSDSVEGMSATKMRRAVMDRDIHSFREGAPSSATAAQVQQLYDMVDKGLMEAYEADRQNKPMSFRDFVEHINRPTFGAQWVKTDDDQRIFDGYKTQNWNKHRSDWHATFDTLHKLIKDPSGRQHVREALELFDEVNGIIARGQKQGTLQRRQYVTGLDTIDKIYETIDKINKYTYTDRKPNFQGLKECRVRLDNLYSE